MTFSRLDENQKPVSVDVDDERIRIQFDGGLQLSVPTSRSPRLLKASREQRAKWELTGNGQGIHWPDVDEDLSIRGLFQTYRRLPESPAEQVPALVSDLTKTTARLNALFPERRFTPDGHLVGSIGEVVAQYIYGLELEPCSYPQIDAHTKVGATVQIKLTGTHGNSYAFRWPLQLGESKPDFLVALQLTEAGFVEVYNGEFPVALLQGKASQRNGQVKVSITALRSLNRKESLPHVQSFDSINRWFTPDLADVA